ncbi:MAG: riboflavin biosynthesis protein RibD [Bacillales bacterium]|jgi:dihydrofolate reductase|nr:riboflavin biosynthesis protein RibD [Bacillales bacterium]
MKRKIILNLAMSIDGYIADENGGYDWIVGDGSNHLDTIQKWDFNKFLENVDVVVAGKNCYDQNILGEYKDKKVLVATSKEMEDHDNYRFIKDDIVQTVLEERKLPGKDIYLFGGGKLVDHFMKADVVDEIIIGIIPTILGKGIPLFLNNGQEIKLKMDEYIFENGIAILKYSKR